MVFIYIHYTIHIDIIQFENLLCTSKNFYKIFLGNPKKTTLSTNNYCPLTITID